MNVVPPPEPTSGEGGVALSEYFTGYIGQIGTQFDGLGHQGGNIEYATAAGRLRGDDGGCARRARAARHERGDDRPGRRRLVQLWLGRELDDSF